MLIKLSPSKLNMFNECPRCFYDTHTLKIVKPRGIFPSLPGGMDRVIKAHFDNFRGSMPPEIKDRVEGVLMKDQALLKRWRYWGTGMTYKDDKNDILLIGAIDDCVVWDNPSENMVSYHIPLDYKTKGSEPKDDGSQYYQTQLDCYNLMLLSTGYLIKEIGYLVYFYPVEVNSNFELDRDNMPMSSIIDNLAIVEFDINVYEIPCSSERAKEIVRKAAECLRSEKRPEPSNLCEHCAHVESKIVRDREERGNG